MPHTISGLHYFIQGIKSTVMTSEILYQHNGNFCVSSSGRRSSMMSIDYIATAIMLHNINRPIIVVPIFLHFAGDCFYLFRGSFTFYHMSPF